MFLIIKLGFLGLLVGMVAGLTGASGVLVLVPVLSTFFDLPLPIILGTSLFVDVIASMSISCAYAKAKNLDIKGVVWILVGSLFGAQVGSYFVVSISGVLIIVALSVCMVFFGLRMWKSGRTKGKSKPITIPEKYSRHLRTSLGMLISGLLIGLTTGIFGAGGGLTIFIILYSFLKFPIKKAIGTSSFIMLLTALSGVVGYAENSNLDVQLGLIVGISAAIGGALSSIFANKTNEEFLARLIGVFFVFLALIMFTLKVVVPFFGLDF